MTPTHSWRDDPLEGLGAVRLSNRLRVVHKPNVTFITVQLIGLNGRDGARPSMYEVRNVAAVTEHGPPCTKFGTLQP